MESLPHCPLCKTDWLKPRPVIDRSVSGEIFSVTSCAQCGYTATNPRPTPDQIGRYYESSAYISHTNTSAGLQDKLYQYFRNRALDRKRRLISRHHRTGALLDYGCGTGHFLAHMQKHGFKATGVEPNAKARAIAGRLTDSPILADLKEAPMGPFDIVTLWHVLEHVHEPPDLLRQLHTHMHQGSLLVIAVPNRSSWDAQYFASEWAAWDVPRHLHHFRRQDIHRLLILANFKPVREVPMWLDAPYVCALSLKNQGAGLLMSLLVGGTLGVWSNVVAWFTGRPTSSTIYLAKRD
jgi:SAM-dependent methyltransferase